MSYHGHESNWLKLSIPASLLIAALLGCGTSGIAQTDLEATINASVASTSQAQSHMDATVNASVSATLQASGSGGSAAQPSDSTSNTSPSSDTSLGKNSQGYDLMQDSQGHQMVLVLGGTFNMGSSSEPDPDQRPVRPVTLNHDYWVDIYEVTNAQFVVFLNDHGNQNGGGALWYNNSDPDARIRRDGSSFSVRSGYDDHPVTFVSWFGSDAYCQWRGARLPTEAEWEYAARGTEKWLQPWGSGGANIGLLNYNGQVGDTTPVGSYPSGVSPFGVYDMAGNVWEWVNDWYDSYAGATLVDPKGPGSGTHKISRGGSWDSIETKIRSSYRNGNRPQETFNDMGFRCVNDN